MGPWSAFTHASPPQPRRSRHELGNALRPLRADRTRPEQAFSPDQPGEIIRRNGMADGENLNGMAKIVIVTVRIDAQIRRDIMGISAGGFFPGGLFGLRRPKGCGQQTQGKSHAACRYPCQAKVPENSRHNVPIIGQSGRYAQLSGLSSRIEHPMDWRDRMGRGRRAAPFKSIMEGQLSLDVILGPVPRI